MLKTSINTYLILEQAGKILLSLRKNTGYLDGFYSLVAGHVEQGEAGTAGMCREALEEIGIIIYPNHLKTMLTMHRKSNRDNIDLFMHCATWQNEIINAEPHKCGGLDFFDYDKLPENTSPYVLKALGAIKGGVTYLELDF